MWNFVLGLGPRTGYSYYFFSAYLQKFSRIVQVVTIFPISNFFDPLFLEGFLHYIPPSHWYWPSICWSYRSLLECLSHLPPSPTFCELQQPRWYYSGVISSLMWSDRQPWAFNTEVTASPGIAPPPCSYGWPTMLILFAWDARRGCL